MKELFRFKEEEKSESFLPPRKGKREKGSLSMMYVAGRGIAFAL